MQVKLKRLLTPVSVTLSTLILLACGGEIEVDQSPHRPLEGTPVEVVVTATPPDNYSVASIEVIPDPGFIFEVKDAIHSAVLEFIPDPDIDYVVQSTIYNGGETKIIEEPFNLNFLYRYNQVGDYGLGIHVQLPSKKAPAGGYPTILYIHGGSWNSGDYSYFRTQWYDANRRGYAVAAINYRHTDAYKTYDGVEPEDVRWPAQIQDARCALVWLGENADRYNLNTDQFAAVGYSAGAHMSLLLGLTNSEDHPDKFNAPCSEGKVLPKLQAASVFSAPIDLEYTYKTAFRSSGIHEDIRHLVNYDSSYDDGFYETLREASPLTYFDENSNLAILAFHGVNDNWIKLGNIEEQLANAIENAFPDGDYPFKRILLEGYSHNVASVYNWARPLYLDFFDRHVKGDDSAPEVTCEVYPDCAE